MIFEEIPRIRAAFGHKTTHTTNGQVTPPIRPCLFGIPKSDPGPMMGSIEAYRSIISYCSNLQNPPIRRRPLDRIFFARALADQWTEGRSHIGHGLFWVWSVAPPPPKFGPNILGLDLVGFGPIARHLRSITWVLLPKSTLGSHLFASM